MQKKIKDLTLGECRKFCNKYRCEICPINEYCDHYFCSYERLDLEKEVEVDE